MQQDVDYSMKVMPKLSYDGQVAGVIRCGVLFFCSCTFNRTDMSELYLLMGHQH